VSVSSIPRRLSVDLGEREAVALAALAEQFGMVAAPAVRQAVIVLADIVSECKRSGAARVQVNGMVFRVSAAAPEETASSTQCKSIPGRVCGRPVGTHFHCTALIGSVACGNAIDCDTRSSMPPGPGWQSWLSHGVLGAMAIGEVCCPEHAR